MEKQSTQKNSSMNLMMLLYKTFKSTNKQGYEFILEMLSNRINPIIKTFCIPFLLLFIVTAYPGVFYTTFIYIKNTIKEVEKDEQS